MKNKTEKTNEKKKMSKGAIALIIGLIIILIPSCLFGYILLSASLKNHEPVIGSRFENDLDPAIGKDQISALETEISAISGVEKCSIELSTAQLRVNVDCSDSLSKDEIEALSNKVLGIVDGKLPIGTYFTSSNGKKMYDLAINVYNNIDDDENLIYYLVTKNSNMVEPSTQLVSEPKDEGLAKELRGEEDDLGEVGLQSTGDATDEEME